MKKYKLLLLILLPILLTGCFFPVRMTRVIGSGNLVTESRNVSNFTAVDLSGVGKLIITQGGRESLEITAEDNIIKYLESKIVGKSLRLGLTDNVSIDPKEDIVYELTVENLERIVVSGAGSVEVGSIICNDLEVEVSGAGDVIMDYLRANSFSLDVSGAGDVTIDGEVEDQRVDLSGASDYQAGGLESKNTQIKISGAGNAVIWVENELDVLLSGVGEVHYYGNPLLNFEVTTKHSVRSLGKK